MEFNELGDSSPRIERRWNVKGEESWCIIYGGRIIGFGPGHEGNQSCRDAFRRLENLKTFTDCPDFTISVKSKAAPEPKVGESGLSDEQLCKQEWPDVYAAFLAEPEADRGWIIRHGRPSNWSPITCQRRETAAEAWADAVLEIKLKPDARERIEAEPEPLPNTRQEETGYKPRNWDKPHLQALNYLNNCLLDSVDVSIEKLREILDAPDELLAAPKVVDSKEEICRHCHKTFDSHPDPGLNCYSEGMFSTRWEPICDLRPKVEEQKCEPCRGSGRHIAGSDCPNCNGTGIAEEQDGEQELPPRPRVRSGDMASHYAIGETDAYMNALEAENKPHKAKSVAPPPLPKQPIEEVSPQAEKIPHRVLMALDRIGYRVGFSENVEVMKFIENELLDVWEHHSFLPDPQGRAAAPVALPTHRVVGRAKSVGYAHLRCSCGRIFVAVGDEALASSRASFEAHLPEKEGK